MRHRFALTHGTAVLAVIALAACVPPAPEPTPAPSPAPVPVPTPAPTPVATPSPVPTYSNWMDAPATPGDWTYANGTAQFGAAASGARLTLRCAAGVVELSRAGTAAGPLQMIVRTEAMERGLDASPVAGGAPQIVARVNARDPLLDAMAFSKGRFAVEIGGLEPLYVPAWPEVSRVIEDCR